MTKSERIIDLLARRGYAIACAPISAYARSGIRDPHEGRIVSRVVAEAEVRQALALVEADEIIAQHAAEPAPLPPVPAGGGPVDAVMAKLSAELARRARILKQDDELSLAMALVLQEIVESIAVAVNS